MTAPRRAGHPAYLIPMRLILPLLLLLPTTALGWEAGTDGPLCTLEHAEPGAEVRLTYDPAGPTYTITLTAPEPWPSGPVFALRFEGGQGLTISTDRHVLSQAGRALTVTDRGFGNVLRGLAENTTATGLLGAASVGFSLDCAAPAVAEFEACGRTPSV